MVILTKEDGAIFGKSDYIMPAESTAYRLAIETVLNTDGTLKVIVDAGDTCYEYSKQAEGFQLSTHEFCGCGMDKGHKGPHQCQICGENHTYDECKYSEDDIPCKMGTLDNDNCEVIECNCPGHREKEAL